METVNDYKGFVTIKDRCVFEMDGIESILTFDDTYVSLKTNSGVVFIEGVGMRVEDLSHITGKIKILGKINSVSFEALEKRRGRFGIF